MARLIHLGTPTNNRRHGVVFATQVGNPTLRHTAIPVQPKTAAQNQAQLTFSAAAALWYSLDATAQAAWNAIAGTGSSGYAVFVAYAQLVSTWGCYVYTEPLNPAIINADGVLAMGNGPTAGTAQFLVFSPTIVTTGFEAYIRLYLQVSDLTEVRNSGSAGGPPIIPAPQPYVPPSGYIYVASFGPMASATRYAYDVTDIILGLIGRMPTPVTFDATTGTFYGSHTALRYYFTDYNGIPFRTVTAPVYPETILGGWFDTPPF